AGAACVRRGHRAWEVAGAGRAPRAREAPRREGGALGAPPGGSRRRRGRPSRRAARRRAALARPARLQADRDQRLAPTGATSPHRRRGPDGMAAPLRRDDRGLAPTDARDRAPPATAAASIRPGPGGAPLI